MENPWNIQSIYEFQYFNCPSCVFKNHSKQEFVKHAYEFHPESIDYFTNICDGSLKDVECPWNMTNNAEDLIFVDPLDNSNLNQSVNKTVEFVENENSQDNSDFEIKIQDIRTGDPFANETSKAKSDQNLVNENIFNAEILNNIKTEEYIDDPISIEENNSNTKTNETPLDTKILQNIKSEEYYFNYKSNEMEQTDQNIMENNASSSGLRDHPHITSLLFKDVIPKITIKNKNLLKTNKFTKKIPL